MLKIIAIAAALLLSATTANATDYWVAGGAAGCTPSPSCGSDSSPGTQALPFRTIQHADNVSASGFGAGSTVHVGPGTYPGAFQVGVKNGSAASPITYVCDVKWSCRIVPTASESNVIAIQLGAGSDSLSTITNIATNSANCSGTPPCIQVTLSAAPPGNATLTNGQIIQINGAPVNTAANGNWAITVVSSTVYTLNNSAFLNIGATGTFRQGVSGAYTIFDGFDVDGTYPGTGTIWYNGIYAAGNGDIVRNNKAHDFAYIPGANNGSSGGSCISDDAAFYGSSKQQFYNNLVYHCGPKGQQQSRIHGMYISSPFAKAYNNIIWGVSGLCIESWHMATNLQFVNNTEIDCLDGAVQIGGGDMNYPHLLTANPTNASTTLSGISNTAGIVPGMGVYDQTNPSCIQNASMDINFVASVTNSTTVVLKTATGSGCTTGDVIQFGGPNTGSYVANNFALNGGAGGMGSGGATINNTYTNNAQDVSTTWGFSGNGGETHVNDQTITSSCLVHYTASDGANSDFHLAYGCNAIAAGTATNAPGFDFDRYPVPTGSAVDIGAYASNPAPHGLIDKYWNWQGQGYSTAFTKDWYANSTSAQQGTNSFGAQTRIGTLDGTGNLWLNGGLTVGWPSTGPCGQGCINAQSLAIGGVQIAPSPVPNTIINASMDFDQQNQGAGYSVNNSGSSLTNPTLTLDGWNGAGNTAGGGITVQQISTGAPPGFKSFLEAKVLTGNAAVGSTDFFLIYQPIEAGNITNYGFGAAGAQPLCISFYSRSSVPSAVVGGALQNAARNRSYPFIFVESTTQNTWQGYSVCLPGDTGGTWVTSGPAEGMRLTLALEAGSSFQTATVATAAIFGVPGSTFVPSPGTTGAWAGSELYGSSALTQLTKTSLATLDITGVQLEESPINNPFVRKPQYEAWLEVQRYAYRLAEPVAGVNVGSCQATAAAVQTCQIPLPATMRAAPSACSITIGTFKEMVGGTAMTWVTPVGGTNTTDMATIATAITSDVAGAFHMLQGGGGGGVVYCSSRL